MEEVELDYWGCEAIGVGGYHSQSYHPDEGGQCNWCGAKPPCAEPEPEPDYAALGYPETLAFLDDLDTVAHWVEACRGIIIAQAAELAPDGGIVLRIKKNQDDV